MTESIDESSTKKGDRSGLVISLIVLSIFAGMLYLAFTKQERDNLGAVRMLLKDPSSAQFDKVQTVGTVTCGLVNAKNSMGAYTGYELFYADSGSGYIGDSAIERLLSNNEACSHDALMVIVGSR